MPITSKTAAGKAAKRAVKRNTKESRLGKSAATARKSQGKGKSPTQKRVRIGGKAPRR